MGLRRPECNQAVCDTRSGITVQVESGTCPSCWRQQVIIRRPRAPPSHSLGCRLVHVRQAMDAAPLGSFPRSFLRLVGKAHAGDSDGKERFIVFFLFFI